MRESIEIEEKVGRVGEGHKRFGMERRNSGEGGAEVDERGVGVCFICLH